MPVAVACPTCQARYSLPDELVGKPVKCKACGTAFKINPALAQPGQTAQQGQTNSVIARKRAVARSKPAVSNEELARAGLDGPIKESLDLFGEAANPQFDPLANHVVHDPGFAEFDADDEEETARVASELDQVLQNTAIRRKATKKKKEDPLAQYLQGDALMGLEDADEDIRSTMNVTANTLFAIGGWWGVLAGLRWLGVFETEFSTTISMFNMFSAIVMIITGFMILFRILPVTSMIVGTIAFFGIHIVSVINDPSGLWVGIIYKGISGLIFVLGIVVVFKWWAEEKDRASVNKKKKRKQANPAS